MKLLFLKICKALGFFHVAQKITSNRPRILCYHGMSISDEHLFRPGLFMQESTFQSRMALVRKWGFQVISLEDLSKQISQKQFGNNQAVITIDDGWAGIMTKMIPHIQAQKWPATLYLSSYYAANPTPVFNVAVAYLFWKAPTLTVPDDSLTASLINESTITLNTVLALEPQLTLAQREKILGELARAAQIDLDNWRQQGNFYYLTQQQLVELKAQGLAIESHTHRHIFPPEDLRKSSQEIADNAQWIATQLNTHVSHFCYPSGVYKACQFSTLESHKMKTATTTHNELVSANHHKFELPRIMDSNALSAIEFEAELVGLMCLIRNFRR